MEGITIPKEDVVALSEVAPGVHGLRIIFVNVFTIASGNGWVLVDAGVPGTGAYIRGWAKKNFSSQERPSAIILTHAHFDHVGALKDLAEDWDVPVYLHRDEIPHITGKAKYPPPDASVGGGLMAIMSPLYSRGPVDIGARARVLPEDGTIPQLDGWRWIHTPGHTDGHVSFFRDSDRTLLVGDAFCTTKPEAFMTAAVTQTPELHGPPAYFTPDWKSARQSVQKLAALRPQIIAPGHGQAIAGQDAADRLAQMAAHFDEIARPKKDVA
jgi:glyoxylase-like metal-dependent hydrolase (beta-lactamase superfamily II)